MPVGFLRGAGFAGCFVASDYAVRNNQRIGYSAGIVIEVRNKARVYGRSCKDKTRELGRIQELGGQRKIEKLITMNLLPRISSVSTVVPYA